MAKPGSDKLTPAQFNKYSDNDKRNFVESLKNYYFIQNLSRDEVLECMNITISTLKYVMKLYNLKKDKSLVQKNIDKTFLDKYGHTGWANRDKIKQTMIERYGADNPLKVESIKEKVKNTNNKRYGGNAPACSSEIQAKMQQTCMDKYNSTNPYGSDEIKTKIKYTKLSRYNDEHFVNKEKISQTWQNKSSKEMNDIRIKREQTNLEKFGFKNPFENKDFMRQVYLNKYGVDHPWKVQSIREKIKQTIQEKYGVPYYCLTEDCISHQGKTISKVNLRFAKLLEDNNIEYEHEFVLEDKAYDFKVGNTLIEINPTYTHNSTVGPYIHDKLLPGKDEHYHLDKTLLANKYEFKCIHIFDNDDWNKVVNMFIPKKNKVYARNCEIKLVPLKETNAFLNTYHLQNTCRGQSIRLGLFYHDELIEIMTFGKSRYNKKYEYELLRLCTHKDYVISGGSEKLWSYFLNNYNPKSIISYCDNSKFSGAVYERLGMEYKGLTQPVGNWYNLSSDEPAMFVLDSLLRQRGYDQLFSTSYGKGTSNVQLMIEHGWVQVYNCGQKVFVYNNKNN